MMLLLIRKFWLLFLCSVPFATTPVHQRLQIHWDQDPENFAGQAISVIIIINFYMLIQCVCILLCSLSNDNFI